MGGPEAVPLLDLAAKAEELGFDSVWVGDSLVARPRYEALTLLAAIAICAPIITLGTPVLLPVLRVLGSVFPETVRWTPSLNGVRGVGK